MGGVLGLGALAAMALPPQIAVPFDIRVDVFLSIFRYLPIKYPASRVIPIVPTVKKNPSLPAFIASSKFMVKPRHTTETCKRRVVAFLLICMKGCPVTRAMTRPSNNATGGLRNNTDAITQVINISCL